MKVVEWIRDGLWITYKKLEPIDFLHHERSEKIAKSEQQTRIESEFLKEIT